MTDTSRYAAGYPGRKAALSQEQTALVEELLDDPHGPAFDVEVVKDEQVGIYNAMVGSRTVARLTYDVAAGDRIVLLAASVLPGFRKQGVATELIRRALDDVRAQGKTVTIMCPVVRTFIEHNPRYADLIDSAHPGVSRRPSGRTV
jgi:predicted GNAT family acetyltransferase